MSSLLQVMRHRRGQDELVMIKVSICAAGTLQAVAEGQVDPVVQLSRHLQRGRQQTRSVTRLRGYGEWTDGEG